MFLIQIDGKWFLDAQEINVLRFNSRTNIYTLNEKEIDPPDFTVEEKFDVISDLEKPLKVLKCGDLHFVTGSKYLGKHFNILKVGDDLKLRSTKFTYREMLWYDVVINDQVFTAFGLRKLTSKGLV